MQHIHLNIWQRHTALSLAWKDHVIRSHGVAALGLTYIPPSLLLMRRHAGGRHWPVVLATSCALFCTDWLNRPGAWPVFAFLTGKSPLSSNKAWYKVQRMLVSSWCGVASSCGCSNSEQRGEITILICYYQCFGAVCVEYCENTESRTVWAWEVCKNPAHFAQHSKHLSFLYIVFALAAT